ncbi:MAG: 5-formyltetrahydrofolate cyclo-ligase [Candidatus Aenigmarchaeota archaeon]|nr:5-formyltetrahydrofolate cyclo-ligase [Candidatus Aenigmarchaeota archaeon]
MMQKEVLRKLILKQRNALDAHSRELKSLAIAKNVLSLDFVSTAKTICTYVTKGSEVDTKQLIPELFKRGKTVLVPVVVKETLALSELRSLDELVEGAFDVPEPKQEHLRPVIPSAADVIIVPGVAFDSHGRRIGYGKGYYDRLLKSLSEETTIVGMAYDVQVVERLPSDDHDAPMQYIVTETAIIQCRR